MANNSRCACTCTTSPGNAEPRGYLLQSNEMYYQQRTTKLEAMGPMPIDPGPDLVCRMAARSFAQVCPAAVDVW